MHEEIEKIKEIMNAAGLNAHLRLELDNALKKIDKRIQRLDFQQKRSVKDREIAINLLNKTIEDLEQQQNLLAESNRELLQQKQLVEDQSLILKEHFNKLEISYRELEQFSYIASHDLKSPLRNIAGFAQLLKRRYQNKIDETADEYIDFIVKSTVHMNEVIRDLLEYSKMGKDESAYDVVDLNDLLKQVKFNLQDEIEMNQATILSENLPCLKIYETGIMQIFQNLISNAIKFRTKETPIIKIEAHQANQYWKFTLSDNGIGLDEAYQEKVFLPFQRINRNEIKGTGIGLAICKKVVLMHQGNIWYTSEPQNGTTFYFTIYQQEE
jgi:light-regulated signal transduction histidine kinase (bacteriophytochrome)